MISLRQHIFSLVAVFVALAIGIAAGSTVVRGPLLDSTRARLEAAEENISIERAENDELAAELAQLDDWVVNGPAQLVGGRLADTGVLLVVAGDVDDDVVDGLVRTLKATAGSLLAELRISSDVSDPDQVDRVAGILGVTAGDDVRPASVFGERIAALVPPVVDDIAGVDEVVPAGVLRGSFGDLEDAGLVDLLEVDSSPTTVDSVEVLVLTDRNLPNDPAEMLSGLITVSDPTGAAVPTLVAEVGRVAQDNESPVPSFVGTVRDDGRLRDEVSTVDNAETFLGWIAAVLGLEAGRDGSVGHYGFREGADGAIPERRP
ncbi:MAG: copper transporter [Acidimicrobiales bacterium]